MNAGVPTATRRRLDRVAERTGSPVIAPTAAMEEYTEQTATNYRIAGVKFMRWLDARGGALPVSPSVILEYHATLDGLAYNTRRFRLRAISALHRMSGLPDPTADPLVRQALKLGPPISDLPPASPPRGHNRAKPASPSLAAALALVAAVPEIDAPPRLLDAAIMAARLSAQAVKPAVTDGYAIGFAAFSRWCTGAGHVDLPAAGETVYAYLASRAEMAFGTLRNDATAISWVHRMNGCADPTREAEVRSLLDLAKKASRPKLAAPIAPAEIRALLSVLGEEPLDRRDAAYILVKLAGCLQHTQIARLDRACVEFIDDAVLLRVSDDEAFVVGAGSDPTTDPSARCGTGWRSSAPSPARSSPRSVCAAASQASR